VEHRGAWMLEDYRRYNLDQGALVEYRACAQQIPSATSMIVAWSAGAPPTALKKKGIRAVLVVTNEKLPGFGGDKRGKIP